MICDLYIGTVLFNPTSLNISVINCCLMLQTVLCVFNKQMSNSNNFHFLRCLCCRVTCYWRKNKTCGFCQLPYETTGPELIKADTSWIIEPATCTAKEQSFPLCYFPSEHFVSVPIPHTIWTVQRYLCFV